MKKPTIRQNSFKITLTWKLVSIDLAAANQWTSRKRHRANQWLETFIGNAEILMRMQTFLSKNSQFNVSLSPICHFKRSLSRFGNRIVIMVDCVMLGTVYPNYSSFSDNYLLSRLIPKVPAGAWIGEHMRGTCLLLPTQLCLLVANRHPQD